MSKTGQFKATLKPGQRVSFPIEDLSEEDMKESRAVVEGFLRKRGDDNPVQRANQLLFCAVNGVKMDEKGNKSEWMNAPGKATDPPKSVLTKRLTILCGRGFKQYINGVPTATPKPTPEATKNKPGPKAEATASDINEHDLKKMREKKNSYIKEFGFTARADIALLDRLVRLEVGVEKWETILITMPVADSKISDNIKKLTDTMVSLQKALGITAEQRAKVKAQSKEGTVAELFQKYQDTVREWPELELGFLQQELHMLLNKYNRRKEDGSREITASEFKRLARGISVNEAYKLMKRKNPDLYGSEESVE